MNTKLSASSSLKTAILKTNYELKKSIYERDPPWKVLNIFKTMNQSFQQCLLVLPPSYSSQWFVAKCRYISLWGFSDGPWRISGGGR